MKNAPTTPILNIVTALHCEAKPLIEHFQLKKISEGNPPFPIFVNKEQTIHLIVTGVGKVKAAAGTTFLHCWTGSKPTSCFLNIGIAGSTQFALGDCLLIHKIMENSTGRCWYPFVSLIKNKNQGQLITHDVPQQSYPAAGLVDMEGAAFFQTASHFVSQEHIQIMKIVSDNDTSSQNQLNEETVKQFVAKNVSSISDVAHYLLNLSEQENNLNKDPDHLTDFQSTWHFTHSQTLQLKEYLRRWQKQITKINVWDFCKQEKNSAAVINKIMQKLDEHANSLH